MDPAGSNVDIGRGASSSTPKFSDLVSKESGIMASTEPNVDENRGTISTRPKISGSKKSGLEDDLSLTASGTSAASVITLKPTEPEYMLCPSKIQFKCGKRFSKTENISCTTINPRKMSFSVNSKDELNFLNNEASKVGNAVVSFSKAGDKNIVTITSQDAMDERQFNSWKDEVTGCIDKYLDSRVHERKVHLKQDNVKLAKRKLRLMTEVDKKFTFRVMVVFEDDSNLVHIVGNEDLTNVFEAEVITDVERNVTVSWTLTLNKVESDLAHYGSLREKLKQQCPFVDIAEKFGRDEIEVTGFENDVQEAKEFVSKYLNTTSLLITSLSPGKIDLVTKKKLVRKHIQEKLKTGDRTKDWTFHLAGNNIILTGPTETTLDGKLISDLLYEIEFELSESEASVFRSDERRKLSGLKANYAPHMILSIDENRLQILCTNHFKDDIRGVIKSMLIQTKTFKVSSEFGEFLQLRGKSILESRDFDMESDFLQFSWVSETSEIQMEGRSVDVEKLLKTFDVIQEGYKKQKFAVTRDEIFSRLNSHEGIELLEKVGKQKRSILKIERAPTISLVKGKIEEQKTSIIVNSVGPDLKLNVGQPKIAASIYEKGGTEFQRHILTKCPNGIKHGEMVIAEKKGNLACNWVFNCCLREYINDETTKKDLKEMLLKCLEETKNNRNYKSIAFPALGTGILKFPANIAAKTTFDVICKFCAKNERSSLEEIKVVLFPEAPGNVRKHFEDEFARRSKKARESFQLTDDDIAHGYLWICSESQDSLDGTKALLQELLK